jgi:hypothetical protein
VARPHGFGQGGLLGSTNVVVSPFPQQLLDSLGKRPPGEARDVDSCVVHPLVA